MTAISVNLSLIYEDGRGLLVVDGEGKNNPMNCSENGYSAKWECYIFKAVRNNKACKCLAIYSVRH